MKRLPYVILILFASISVAIALRCIFDASESPANRNETSGEVDSDPSVEIFQVTRESSFQHRANETMWGPSMKVFELDPVPLIRNDEIVKYYWDSHEIELTSSGYGKIPTGISAVGVDFIITVDGDRVYAGTFHSTRSSDGLSWPTILVNKLDPAPDEILPDDDRIFRVRIDRNFHGVDEYDHRDNINLERAFRESMRLVKNAG